MLLYQNKVLLVTKLQKNNDTSLLISNIYTMHLCNNIFKYDHIKTHSFLYIKGLTKK